MCDGSGRMPCKACGGTGANVLAAVKYSCLSCMGRRTAGACEGCAACKSRKAALAAAKSDQGKLF